MSSSAALVYAEYEEMLKSFRCQDLANLLAFAGQSKNGKKQELLDRCLNILKRGAPNIQIKIREIHSRLPASTTFNSIMSSASNILNTNSNSSSPNPDLINPARFNLPTNIYPPVAQSNLFAPPTSANFNPLMHLQTAAMSFNQAAIISNTNPINNSQVQLNIKFEKLAFYEFINEINRPIRLVGINPQQRPLSCVFQFSLNQEQVNEIINNRKTIDGKFEFIKQVHLRFGYYESTVQKDNLPANLVVNVNQKPAQLPTPKPTSKPNADIIRPGRSIDITHLIRLAPNIPNKLDVNWTNLEANKTPCIGVYFFRKVNVSALVEYLKKNCTEDVEVTKLMVKEKLSNSDTDFEIETTFKVSLQCPLMKFRIQLPGRAITCKHVQCFDLESYLMMNEKKPTWLCPVCDQYSPFDTLIIDSLFKDILNKCPDCEEVEFNCEAEWSKVTKEKEKKAKSSSSNENTNKISSNLNINSCISTSSDRAKDSDDTLSPLCNKQPVSKVEESIVDICDDSFSSTTGQQGSNQPAEATTSKPKEIFIDLTLDSDDEDTTNRNKQHSQRTVEQHIPQQADKPSLKPTQSSQLNQCSNLNTSLNESINEADNATSPSVSIISLSSSESRSQTPVSSPNPNTIPQTNLNKNSNQLRPNNSRLPLSIDTIRQPITSPLSSAGSTASSNLPNLSPIDSNALTPPPINTPPASSDSSQFNSRLARDYSSPKRTNNDLNQLPAQLVPKQTSSLASFESIISNTKNISPNQLNGIINELTKQQTQQQHNNHHSHNHLQQQQQQQQQNLNHNNNNNNNDNNNIRPNGINLNNLNKLPNQSTGQNLNHHQNRHNSSNLNQAVNPSNKLNQIVNNLQNKNQHGLVNNPNNRVNKLNNRQPEYINKEKAMRVHEEYRSSRSPNVMDVDNNSNSLNFRFKESSLNNKIVNQLSRIDCELGSNNQTNNTKPQQIQKPQNRMPQQQLQPAQQSNNINNFTSQNQLQQHSNSQPFFINNKTQNGSQGNMNNINNNNNNNNSNSNSNNNSNINNNPMRHISSSSSSSSSINNNNGTPNKMIPSQSLNHPSPGMNHRSVNHNHQNLNQFTPILPNQNPRQYQLPNSQQFNNSNPHLQHSNHHSHYNQSIQNR